MPEHTIPEKLLEAIRGGNAVLVIGSGVDVPSWKQVLEKMAAELEAKGNGAAAKDIGKLLSKGSFARVTGFLSRTLGDAACDEILKSMWLDDSSVGPVAKALAQVPVRHIWTTFPGMTLDVALANHSPEGWPDTDIRTFRETADIRAHQRVLVKLLGEIDEYAVTPSSVRKTVLKNEDFRTYLSGRYATDTLIFVGFRHGDPDLSILLDRVFSQFDFPESTHYFVSPALGPVAVEELANEHSIEVVSLPKEGDVDKSVAGFLDALAAACRKGGINLIDVEPEAGDLDGWIAYLQGGHAPEKGLTALNAIAAKATSDGDVESAVTAIIGQVEYTEDAGERGVLLHQLAGVYEKAGDASGAYEALSAAIAGGDYSEETLQNAQKLALTAGKANDWVAELSNIAEAASEEQQGSIWTSVGDLYRTELSNIDYAIASYRHALKSEEGNVTALSGLTNCFEKKGQWSDVVETLEKQIASGTKDEASVWVRVAEVNASHLGSPSRAEEAYEKAAALGNENAEKALEKMYKADSQWGKLAALWEKRIERLEKAGEGDQAGALRRELATLRADKLGDMKGAIEKHEAALKKNPQDVEALRAVVELYDGAGRTDDYLNGLERLVALVPDDEKAALLRSLAFELEEHPTRSDEAVSYYTRLLELEPERVDVYRSFERLLTKQENWVQLAKVQRKHVDVLPHKSDKLELLAQIAELNIQKLADPHRANKVYEAILAIDSSNRDAMVGQAKMLTRTESWGQAVQAWVKAANAKSDDANAWAQAGHISLQELENVDQATEYYQEALKADPSHPSALEGLARLARNAGEFGKAMQLFHDAAKVQREPAHKAELLNAAAELADQKLNDTAKALTLRQQVLRIDPSDADASTWVAEKLIERRRWDEAIPILEKLVTVDDGRIHKTKRLTALGAAKVQVGDLSEAVNWYKQAVNEDSEDLDAALGLVETLYEYAKTKGKQSVWADVEKQYRELLTKHRAGFADSTLATVWFHLGCVLEAQSKPGDALGAFKKALEANPQHAQSLDAVSRVAEARKDWPTVVSTKRDLAETLTGKAKSKVLEEIGDVCVTSMKDPVSALGAYLDAAKLNPKSGVILHKILNIYTERGEWRRAVETLGGLAKIEVKPDRRAKYHYSAAVIARDKLHDKELAVEQFQLTLGDEPNNEKAVTAIETLLTSGGKYQELARAYRAILKGWGETVTAEQALPIWKKLGDVCGEHLGDLEAAAAAYEVVSTLDPQDLSRAEELADIYLELGDEHADKAAHTLQRMLIAEPDRVEIYRLLFGLYQKTQKWDNAYCAAQALVFLGQANEQEQALFNQFRSAQLKPVNRRLTEEIWQKAIIHDAEDRRVNAVFSALAGALAATTAQPESAFELSPSQKANVETPSSKLEHVFWYATTILGLEPTPNLYVGGADAEAILVANTRTGSALTPSLLAGESIAKSANERKLAFDLGKYLAYFRPERYVNYALSTLPKIESALGGALGAAGVSEPKGEEQQKFASYLKKNVPQAVLEQVGVVGKRLNETASVVTSWRSATDLTANRVGLILCDDLEVAASSIAREKGGLSTLPAKEKLRDLLAFSVSEEYFAVRRHLGQQVGV